jgi:hypothetical protein
MRIQFFGLTVLALALAGCSSEAPPTETKAEVKKEPEKVAGPITGKEAYEKMYKQGREWSPDIQALSLKSEDVPGQTVADGKAAGWTAVFVSASKGESRTITWALAPFGDYRKGLNAGQPVKWGGPTTKSKPFSMTEVTLDSDEAQKTAASDPKGAEWLKSNSDKPLSFYLGAEQKYTAPVWVVTWGSTKEGYIKALNAATGATVK